MLKNLLEEWGYEVVLAANGTEAQAILDGDGAPMMAILSRFSAGMGGLELCELIRARKQNYVYTILLSVSDHESGVLKGFESGADDYLSRPINQLELKARIKVGERIIRTLEALSKENRALSVEASHDSLLRLWNRRAIFDLLGTELGRAKRLKTPLSVFFVDLDFFKLVNDSYGHLVGDEVLLSVAKKLSRAVREYDHVGRCGGEEFLVVLPNCGIEAALEVAERVRQHIADEPIVTANTRLKITVSIGLSQWHSDQELPELLREADLALYRAKQNGRNRVEVESQSEADVTPAEQSQEAPRSLTLSLNLGETDATASLAARKRQELRHSLTLPVRIWGLDATGKLFEQYASTVDVTTTGAHIAGVEHLLQRGCVIGVEHRSSRARYRVTWVSGSEGEKPGKVGVQLIEIGKFIWGRVLPRVFGDSEAKELPKDKPTGK
jgi:two-component system cell cycle response regulator